MNRVALISILVAMPLLTAGMLAQNDDRSRNGLASASAITADGAPSAQHFNGQWFNGSDSTPDLFYVASPFSISAKSARGSSNRREIAGPSNAFRVQLRAFYRLREVSKPGGVTGSFGYFQPVYESSADQKLVASVRTDIAKLHILRFVKQAQNQSAQFTFERKQNVRAAELRTGGHTESAANLRSSAAARAHNAQRPPSYRHDEDSEISCLISEDDARQALQRQVIVASSVDFARLGEFSSLDSLQPWSDATQAVIKEVSSKVKNTGLTK